MDGYGAIQLFGTAALRLVSAFARQDGCGHLKVSW